MQRVLVANVRTYKKQDDHESNRRFNADVLVNGPEGLKPQEFALSKDQYEVLLISTPCYADADLTIARTYGKTIVMGFASITPAGKFSLTPPSK